MTKQYGHQLDRNGRPVVAAIPKHLRGYDPEWDVVTLTEGPLSRLFSALTTKRTKR